jgi:hypothetical protein
MARIYTAQFNGVAVTAQQDLFELACGTNTSICIHEIFISQSTEVGDAQEEGLSILLRQGATVSGSGGSSPAAVPRDVDDGASATTAKVNNTTKANTGTIVTHCAWNWNVRVPLQILFTPELRPFAKGGRRLTVELSTTPADSITMSGYITWSEGD